MTNTNVLYNVSTNRTTTDAYLDALAPVFAFVCAIIIICTVLGISGYVETHYDTTAEVLSTEDNSVLLVDGAGYVWEVTDRPDLRKGEFVKIKFFNNTTDYTREDDEIIDVKVLDN